MTWENKKVAILGWGIDTADVVPWLLERGGQITVLDKKMEIESEYKDKVKWELGRDDLGDLRRFEVIVRNPAVYRYRSEIVAAEKAGVQITSKTKMFFDECPAKIIGITGTKGKGTTSTLIYEMLKAAGRKVYLGGNIGKGVFELLPKLDDQAWVVLELSSFQLIDLHKSPSIAVTLMVTSEHLDWHKDVDEYIEAKASITKHQLPTDFSVFNDQYPNSVKIGMRGQGQKVPVNKSQWQRETKLRGEHNKENLAAAAAAARAAGVAEETILQIGQAFKGLEHRLEEVAEVKGVKYYNDSFSTTPETAMAAIKAFSEPEIIILGGSDKGSDYTELGRVISESKNIKAVILIGLMADKIEQAIGNKEVKLVKGLKTMKEIVQKASELADSGDVVVLTPACASFDMFKNYKDRGEQFKSEVLKLGNG